MTSYKPVKINCFWIRSLVTQICMYVYLADFLKTNLTKFAVISVKKTQKARFLSPTSPKIIATKEEERRKRKPERGEGKEEKKKKSNGCTLT